MKKILVTISLLILWGLAWFSYAEDFPYENVWNNPTLKESIENEQTKNIAETYVWDEPINQDSPAEYYISTVINYFLSILWFISFLVLAYGFSLVFVEKTDEWVKKWYKFIKIASIALIVIGISWLISIWIINIYVNHVR